MSDDKVNGRLRTVIGIAFGDNVMSTYNAGKYTINSSLTSATDGGNGLIFTEAEIDEVLTEMVRQRVSNI